MVFVKRSFKMLAHMVNMETEIFANPALPDINQKLPRVLP